MVSGFRGFCSILVLLSVLSTISLLYRASFYSHEQSLELGLGLGLGLRQNQNRQIDLLTFPSAWNHLSFPPNPPQKLLKIALFVKKWPDRRHAGGLERHALTLHLALAKRGHELHIFTASSPNFSFPNYPFENLHFHLSKPTDAGYLNQALIWKQFQDQNSSGKPFDVVHTESVSLMHTRSKYVSQ